MDMLICSIFVAVTVTRIGRGSRDVNGAVILITR